MSKALLTTSALLLLAAVSAPAQQSDYEIKRGFEQRHERLARALEAVTTTTGLDSVRDAIDGLEIDYTPHEAFLDKALYPVTFAGKVQDLRTAYARTYDMLHVAEIQGAQIIVMESTISELTTTLDTLRTERERLFAELQQNRSDLTALRLTVRRLQEHLRVKDQLLFAMVDSLFMPYGADLARVGDVQRSNLSSRLERSNVLHRIQDIASDNLRFLKATGFQAGDFAGLIDNYEQFQGRWGGLSERIMAVTLTDPAAAKAGPQARRNGTVKPPAAAAVDSLMLAWRGSLQQIFWKQLATEFASRGVGLLPFTDGPGFSTAIRTYVQTVKAQEIDARVFVEDVWNAHIDTDWKPALTKESMLGNEEYAALHTLVLELKPPPAMDTRYPVYIGLVAAVALVIWWFLARKRRPHPPEPAAQ